MEPKIAKSERAKEQWRKYSYTPKGRYQCQKRSAKKRNISWNFTFNSWWKVWQDSGKWEERTHCGYVMGRNGDTGPYSPDNVQIITHSQNLLAAWENGIFDNRPKNQRNDKGQFIKKGCVPCAA